MNTVGFFTFWGVMITFFILLFKGNDRPFIIIGRIAGMVAMLLFLLYFLLGSQPRMWG